MNPAGGNGSGIPGSDQANRLKKMIIMAISGTNFTLDAHFSPRKWLAKGRNATRPSLAALACTERDDCPALPRTAAPHYTVIKTLAPTGKRYGRSGAGTAESNSLEAR